MKTFTTLCVVICIAHSLLAQLDIPPKSPKASIAYQVGLTNITIQYSSPAVRGRKIWDGIVAYNEVWRAGANASTNIEFSTDVQINGKTLPQGKYAFFLIPKTGDTWTAIFNKNPKQWGAFIYKDSLDALRTEVKVEIFKNHTERLKYDIVEKKVDEGIITMVWEKKRVIIPFTTDAIQVSIVNIEKGLQEAKVENKWFLLGEAALFHMDESGDLDAAMRHIEESVNQKEGTWNWWIKARVLAKKGDYKSAIMAAEKVKSIAASDKEERSVYGVFERDVAEALLVWKKKG